MHSKAGRHNMTPDKIDFKQQQQLFAAHIRNPETTPAPGNIEPRRLKIYQELFFNNVNGFLGNTFPVLRSILSEEHWIKMARDFFSTHECSTPLFAEISQEFLAYLQYERKPHADDPSFMLELAHYEWIEMAIAISDDDQHDTTIDPNGDLLASRPILSPVMQNLSYHYPVHRIGPDFQPSEPPEEMTHLVVYRNRQDEVQFLQINTAIQQLIETLKHNPRSTGLDVITMIAESINHPDPEVVIEAGKTLLYNLRQKHVVIGTAA
jgi:hypothetical protein